MLLFVDESSANARRGFHRFDRQVEQLVGELIGKSSLLSADQGKVQEVCILH